MTTIGIQRISQVDGLDMLISTKNCRFFFRALKTLPGMVCCSYGYQKWIPDNFLHRNDNSIFFSTHFFFDKNFHFENEKIFFRGIFKIFGKSIFFKGKIWFSFNDFRKFSNFQNFPKTYFLHFQSEFFCRKKMSWEKKWIIISM